MIKNMLTRNRTKEKSTENSHGINDQTLCKTTDPTRSHQEALPYKITYVTKFTEDKEHIEHHIVQNVTTNTMQDTVQYNATQYHAMK